MGGPPVSAMRALACFSWKGRTKPSMRRARVTCWEAWRAPRDLLPPNDCTPQCSWHVRSAILPPRAFAASLQAISQCDAMHAQQQWFLTSGFSLEIQNLLLVIDDQLRFWRGIHGDSHAATCSQEYHINCGCHEEAQAMGMKQPRQDAAPGMAVQISIRRFMMSSCECP